MDRVSFGKLFKLVRTEKGISQSELSYGICTPRTIYNIENGYNTPSIELMLHFANKLGFDFLSILSYSNSENGLLYYKTFRNIEKLYENGDFPELNGEVDKILAEVNDLSPYQYQILHWYKGICFAALDNNYEEAKKQFVHALSCTKEYGINEIARHYCTIQELHILNSYANILFLQNDLLPAETQYVSILNNLLRYSKSSNDPLYLKISYNLAKCRNKMGKPKDALHICMKAIVVAQKNNILNSLAELYIEKGNSHDLLGETEERNKAFKRFIYLHELCGNTVAVREKKRRFEKVYHIDFDEL